MTNPTNASVDPLVIEFFRLQRLIRMPVYLIGEKAGVNNNTIGHWKDGRYGPNLFSFQAVLEVLGYRLKIVPIDGVRVTHTPARLGRRAYVDKRGKPCE